MKRKPYMLATDLDGTLVGQKEKLHSLLNYFRDSNYEIALVYITGRHLASTLSLIRTERLPMPDILISDVGTVIYTSNHLLEDEIWTKKMQTNWQPERIIKLASPIKALTKQTLPNERRISFTVQAENKIVRQLEQTLNENEIPHKFIYSSNRDIDILPLHSGKGEALTYVINEYACPDVKILVAGDSGNDLDMLSLGYPSVIVGNAQPELSSMKSHPLLYRAKDVCAGGIQEAWIYFYGDDNKFAKDSIAMKVNCEG